MADSSRPLESDTMQVDEHIPAEDALIHEQSDLSDSEDDDSDDSDEELAEPNAVVTNVPGAITQQLPVQPTQQIQPVDRIPDRRPRVVDVPDDDERVRRTPTPRHVPDAPMLPNGAPRLIRPLPRSFGGSRSAIPPAGSYVNQGIGAGHHHVHTHPMPGPSSIPPPQQQPTPTSPQQAQPATGWNAQPQLPPAWFASLLQSILAQPNGRSELVVGPDGFPRVRTTGNNDIPNPIPTPTNANANATAGAQAADPPTQPPTNPGAAPQIPPPVPPFDFFSMFDTYPRDDPAQARRLLEGLEEIPMGLVKRYVRAEEANGGNGVCAVCFEGLDAGLDGDQAADWSEARSAAAAAENDPATASGSAATTEPASQPTQTQEPLPPRAVVLPCGHPFHSTCLEPWFAHHTTCPNCRFDIDPDRLTSTAYIEGRRGPQPFDLPPEFMQGLLAQIFGALGQQGPAQRQNQQPQQPQQPAPTQPHPPTQPAPSQTAPQMQPQPQPVPQPQPQPQPPRQQRAPGGLQTGGLPPELLQTVLQQIFGGMGGQTMPQQQQAPRPPQPAPNPMADLFNRFAGGQPETTPMFGPPRPQTIGTGPAAAPGLGDGIRIHLDIGVTLHGPGEATPPAAQTQPQNGTTMIFDVIFGVPQDGVPPTPPPPGTAAGAGPPPPPPFGFTFPTPGMFAFPTPAGAAPRRQPPPAGRKWLRPESKGQTLRQRVESLERSLGLCCDAPSCDIAPTDDDPAPTIPGGSTPRTVHLLHSGESKCAHSFHPQCIVSAARVAGATSGHDADPSSVACPVCRIDGAMDPAGWAEGERALLEGLQS